MFVLMYLLLWMHKAVDNMLQLPYSEKPLRVILSKKNFHRMLCMAMTIINISLIVQNCEFAVFSP